MSQSDSESLKPQPENVPNPGERTDVRIKWGVTRGTRRLIERAIAGLAKDAHDTAQPEMFPQEAEELSVRSDDIPELIQRIGGRAKAELIEGKLFISEPGAMGSSKPVDEAQPQLDLPKPAPQPKERDDEKVSPWEEIVGPVNAGRIKPRRRF